MASSWGDAWGDSWGDSWGTLVEEPATALEGVYGSILGAAIGATSILGAINYEAAVVVDNNVTIDKWQQPFSVAVPIPRPAPVGGSPFVPREATVDNTTGTVWPLTQGEKARPSERPAPQGYHLFVPAEATVDNTTVRVWPLTQGEKARPIGRVAPQGVHLFVPDEATSRNTTNRVWPLVFGEKAKPVARPAQQGQHLFVPKEAVVDNTVDQGWWQPLSTAVPVPPTWHTQPVYAYITPFEDNTVTIDKWQQPLGMRAVPIARPAPLGGQPFVPAEATVDNTTVRVWPLTFGEKARPIPRPAPVGWSVYGFPYEGVDNTRNEWDWVVQWPDRMPRFWWKGRPYQPFVPREAVLENTTNVVWPLTQGAIARPVPRPARQGSHLFVPREATVDNTTNTVWPLTQGGKAQPVPRTAPLGSWVFGYPYLALDNTTNVVWPLTQGFTASPIPRVAPQGQWSFGFPYEGVDNTRDQWDWYLSWPDRMPRYWWKGRPYQPFVPRAAVLENTQTPDKWLQRWRGPPRYWPRPTQPQWPHQLIVQPAAQYQQEISATLTFTVDIHICGWGTEAQASDASADESEQADAWTVQPEADVTFGVETEVADAWSEQAESSDEYDEKDECGRG